jgi:hypothetical protein
MFMIRKYSLDATWRCNRGCRNTNTHTQKHENNNKALKTNNKKWKTEQKKIEKFKRVSDRPPI